MKASGVVLGVLTAGPLLAADFDGSKNLICATSEAHDCMSGEECLSGSPRRIGAPTFMRLDFAKKTIVGPRRSTTFRQVDASDEQLILQGTEDGFGWTLALDKASGDMSITLTDRRGAFVVFGSCTPD